MRLKQTLTKVLCVQIYAFHRFSSCSAVRLVARRTLAARLASRTETKIKHSSGKVHFYYFRSLSSCSLSTAQLLTHSPRSLFTQPRAYCSAEKRSSAFTVSVFCASSDAGGMTDEGEGGHVSPMVEWSEPQSTGEEQTEETTCSDIGAEEKQSEIECFKPQGLGTEGVQNREIQCSDLWAGEQSDAEMVVGLGPQDLSDQKKGVSNEKTGLPSNKPDNATKVSTLSKRAQKKLLRKEKLKAQRKAKRAPNFTNNSSPGFNSDLFEETDYYFENGLRKVYPYPYTFSTYAKERWYGQTLQDIFEREFRVDSPDNFRTSVTKGYMRVNGKVAGLNYIIKNGDLIEHHIHRHENPVSGTDIEILEDREDVVVINKPASIPCHPCGKFRFNTIVFIMGKELGYANLRNIYRLDRLTSGVLIMGKTARKTKELENHVLHRRVHKEYVARVVGEFPQGEVTVDKPLNCLSHKLTLWQVVQQGGKSSRTTFHRLSYNGQTSVVKCIPHTGRTHQIRVHLQYLGHPIVNDPYYNSPAWGPLRGKGGHCDVSLEELCQRIMKEHNVGLWCDGENPLFKQRLAETRKKDLCDGASVPAETGSEELDEQYSLSCRKEESCIDQLTAEGSPPAKRPRPAFPLSSSPGTGIPLGADVIQQPVLPQSTVHTSNLELEDSEPCGRTHIAASQVPQTSPPESGATQQEEVGSEPEQDPVQGQRRTKVEQKGFDPQRWVPDPLCESCRLKYIDPKPTDLLLYLHALRYKGPGWDYKTSLPAWAAEDWQEPDEYKKYL